MHALETLHYLRNNPPSNGLTVWQRNALNGWQSWGALQDVFDERNSRHSAERERLQELLTPSEYSAARRTVLTAFYTDSDLTQAMWDALSAAGFDGGPVLEPGCGKGTFISTSPDNAHMVGVELDPTSARIAALLHPNAQVRSEGLENTPFANDSFTAAIGNVPFDSHSPYDQVHNTDHLSLHNYVINKSLALTKPGGMVAMITSTSTADAKGHKGQAARAALCANADLVTAVRLPSGKDGAFSAGAGTEVGTDILVFRKREEGQEPSPTTTAFLQTTTQVLDGHELPINKFFATHTENILGELHSESGPYGRRLAVRRDAATPLADQVRHRLISDMHAAAQNGLGLTASTAATEEVSAKGLIERDRNAPKPVIGSIQYERTGNKYTFTQLKNKTAGNPQWEPISGSKYAPQWVALIDMRETVTALLESERDNDEQRAAQLRAQANDQYDAYVAKFGPINLHETKEPKAKTKARISRDFTAAARQWRRDNDLSADSPLPPEIEEALMEEASQPSSPPIDYSPHLEGLKADPFINLVKSLEYYESTTKTATKGALLTGATSRTAELATTAESLRDAVRILRFSPDGITPETVADLLDGYTPDRVEREFLTTGAAFRSPADPTAWVPAQKYLTGNVKKALREAEAAAETDQRYMPNVEALRNAQPERKTDGIAFTLGATWIPTDIYAQFARETFGIPDELPVSMEYLADQWVLSFPKEWEGHKMAAQHYGVCADNGEENGPSNFTADDPRLRELPHHGIAGLGNTSVRFSAVDVLAHAMNNKPPQLNYSKAAKGALGYDEETTVSYPEATKMAALKVKDLADYFQTWVTVDPERRERLIDLYNDAFNNFVVAEHDGSDLTFEGLNPAITPYDYQLDAVEQILSSPTTLLNHCVGAGKSGTMFLASMKLKELGISKKPLIVTPNHLAGQLSVEANQWFPTAKVLDGSIGMGGEANVNMVAAQIAAADWDIIVLPEQVFKSMNMSVEYYRDWTEEQSEILRQDLERMKELEAEGDDVAGAFSVKQIERALVGLEKTLAKSESKIATSHGVPFDQLGVDMAFVDEAHRFKNLTRVSKNKDLDCSQGSDKATDMAVKTKWLRETRGQNRPSVVFATGTPYTNNAGEIWALMTYLVPEMLAEQGLSGINAWGHHFTQSSTVMGLSPANQIRQEQRIDRWVNRPALTLQLKTFMSYIRQKDLSVSLPELEGGAPITIKVPTSQEVRDHQRDARWRENNLKGLDPHYDNPLSILNDSRRVAIDPRLGNLEYDPSAGRLKAATDQIVRIWQENKDNTYELPNGSDSPKMGALQIVFLDAGVPTGDPDRVNLYEAIRQTLAKQGMDRNRIAFVHEYDNNKQTLYNMCNDGDIDVVIGNTEKLSTGANIQTRAIAMHHLDVPWKSADFTQREGRLVRQGNQNSRVSEYVYIMPGTSDAKMWSTIKRKADLEEQLFDGNPDLDTVENPPETALFAEGVEGMSLDNPAYARKLELGRELDTLQRRANEHQATRNSHNYQYSALKKAIPRLKHELQQLEYHKRDAMRWQLDTDNRRWFMGGRVYSERKQATAALMTTLRQIADNEQEYSVFVGTIGGVRFQARYEPFGNKVIVSTGIKGSDSLTIDAGHLDAEQVAKEAPDVNLAKMYSGYMQRVENIVKRVPELIENKADELAAKERERDMLERRGVLGDFPDQARLDALTAEYKAVEKEVQEWENSPEKQRERLDYEQRMSAKGRMHGWTKALMPTAYMRQIGVTDHPRAERMALGDYSAYDSPTVIDMEEDTAEDGGVPADREDEREQGASGSDVADESAGDEQEAPEDAAPEGEREDTDEADRSEPDAEEPGYRVRRTALDFTRGGIRPRALPDEGDEQISPDNTAEDGGVPADREDEREQGASGSDVADDETAGDEQEAPEDTTPKNALDMSLCADNDRTPSMRDEDTTPKNALDMSLCSGLDPLLDAAGDHLMTGHVSSTKDTKSEDTMNNPHGGPHNSENGKENSDGGNTL